MEAKRAASFRGGMVLQGGVQSLHCDLRRSLPIGVRQMYDERSQSHATTKKISDLLKSIMGCALSCLFP